MNIFRSLYFRMALMHFAGMISLPLVAFFLVDNLYAQIILYATSVGLIFHEIDERINGKRLSESLLAFLQNMDKPNSSFDASTKMASEYEKIKEIIDKREKLQKEKNQEESIFIDEAKEILNQVKVGVYDKNIEATTQNNSLEEFKKVVNEMIVSTKNEFNKINSTLDDYINYNYKNDLQYDSLDKKGDFYSLANSINKLKMAIVKMLNESKNSSINLQNSSKTLSQNVSRLNSSSKEASSSLNDTTNILEKITLGVKDTEQKAQNMQNLAISLANSSKEGRNFANQTTASMQDIFTKVQLINDSITLIDDIAFQTNILSLNAAVEAATAGEAGKGFAVVAGEVRNLANRSTQAANDIKNLVQTATSKSNEGKEIVNSMIIGYESLNENINKTIELIKQIAVSSNEQSKNTNEINHNINELKKNLNANFEVSNEVNSITNDTLNLANNILEEIGKKSF